MPRDSRLLELRDASRVFSSGGQEVHALRSVSFEVAAGESVAVTGRSGSGKSTLLNVLGLLDGLSSGEYRVGGRLIAGRPSREIDRLRAITFGFVFQAFHLVPHLTTRENVELGLAYRPVERGARATRVDQLLERVGLDHRRDARVTTLSGGERQRTAIARALAADPAVILADEPTGNLDETNAEHVLALFDDVVRSGVALVMVTHDAPTAARADRRFHMRDGELTG